MAALLFGIFWLTGNRSKHGMVSFYFSRYTVQYILLNLKKLKLVFKAFKHHFDLKISIFKNVIITITNNLSVCLCRGGMIQTGEQYEFVHHALSLYEARLSAETGQ